MPTVGFYLDKPYNKGNNGIERVEIQQKVKELKKERKPIPPALLNPRPTSIYIIVTLGHGKSIKIRTDEKIKAKDWDFRNGRAKSTYRGSIELNAKFDQQRADIMSVYREMQSDKCAAPLEDLKAEIIHELNRDFVTRENNFFEAYEEYMKIMENRLTVGTLKEYKTVLKSLRDFQEKENYTLSFEKINARFYDHYLSFLLSKPNPRIEGGYGLLDDTIAKYIITLKAFMNWAHDNELHDNIAFKRFKYKKRGQRVDIVSLKEHELMTMYNLDLSDNRRLEQVRDLFCFAAFTGQRWKDFINFKKEDIRNNCWVFIAHKTKKETVIPFTGFTKPAKHILEKYNYELPKISQQKFNKYLKELGKIAEVNEDVKLLRFSGKREIEIKKPKYLFLVSHSGRRTFITILLERGVPMTTIQKITGHADIRTLMKYENTSQEAVVRALDEVGELNDFSLKVAK